MLLVTPRGKPNAKYDHPERFTREDSTVIGEKIPYGLEIPSMGKAKLLEEIREW